MLNLASKTSGDWIERVLDDFDAVLLDHAHCEKKAAGSAVKLLFQYPDRPFLLQPMAALAREELDHFQQVLERLEKRGVAFKRQRPSPYGGRLQAQLRRDEPGRLLDRLLVSALIEARSCERFQILAEGHPEPEWADFYASLLASEARHHGVYLRLAEQVAPGAEVRRRRGELAEAEAGILREHFPLARLHA